MRISAIRFDFGVPLEDVFPFNDIHPRLRFLFDEAYQSYVHSGLTIEAILRNRQDSLEIKLEFKERLIHDTHYNSLSRYLPGTYFWLIRHFLGLLPVPLLSNYSNGVAFNWKRLSDTFKDFFTHYQNQRKRKSELDYQLAKTLNMLPCEHLLLINVLVSFIRNISQISVDDNRLNRKKLITLVKYYCGSAFNRPYRPGYEIEDKKMFPLFTYLVLRWVDMQKFCNKINYVANFLETREVKNLKDSWVQTSLFSPNITTIYKNVPFLPYNEYLKDTGSQTGYYTNEKGVQVPSEDYLLNKVIEEFNKSKSNPFLNNSIVIEDPYDVSNDASNYYEAKNEENESATNTDYNRQDINKDYKKDEDNLTCNSELNFYSIVESDKDTNWTDVLDGTLETVKRVEEYIYDDYETFSKEEFNQITNSPVLVKPRSQHRMSKVDLFHTSPKNSPRKSVHGKSNDHLLQSYVKFNNGVEEDFDSFHSHNDKIDERENIVQNSLNVTFKSCYNSDENLCSTRVDNSSTHEEKNKTNFNLKRFKIKMDFLRMLTPKRSTPLKPTEYCTSNVSYKKMKNDKANTL